MPRRFSHLCLAVLMAILFTALPAARPAHAQNIVVNTLSDENNGCGPSCSLREAIDLANSQSGANTITFSVAGEIVPLSPLPFLTDDGTTIDGGLNHTVVINGSSAGPDVNGITIRSSNNAIRGLVIYNFNTTDNLSYGSGIYINGAPFAGQPARGDNNRIYGNWIGLDGAGSAAFSNDAYGIFIANGASGNIIGADTSADRNVISGNKSGGLRLFNVDTLYGLIDGNSIVGNYIGLTTAGDGLPSGLNVDTADSGIMVSKGSRNTVVSNNVIGGFNSTQGAIGAGINVTGSGVVVPLDGQSPSGTRITGNYLGVTRGNLRVANRIGIRLGGGEYGPFSTTIGGTAAGERNVIAGNAYRGIDLPDTFFIWGDTTIAGNYIGLDGSGARQANGWGSEAGYGAGVHIGLPRGTSQIAVGKITVGPGNVIGGNRTYGVHTRSSGHVIKGNQLGTAPGGASAGASTTANGAANVLLESGSGVLVGGPTPADRNIMAFAGVVINPDLFGSNSCDGPCASQGHTIEGNYIGVAADGSTPFSTVRSEILAKEGILLRNTSSNTIRNNVIGGLNYGITLGGTANLTQANSNSITGNKIGAPASGEIFFASYPLAAQISAPRNIGEGIRIYRGSGNTISGNLIAYNARESDAIEPYAGIRVGYGNTAASTNVISDNRLVRNGESNAWGIVVDTSVSVQLSRNTTQYSANDGILLSRGGNTGLAAPTGLAISGSNPPTLTGSASACGSGCTVEVFGSSLASEQGEGPVYLTQGPTGDGGSFSIQLPVCLQYLTTTVTSSSGNTSAFSSQLNIGLPLPCQALNITLGAAANPSREVIPGATTIYTHTLSHNSPVALTYTVVFTSSQDWASAPSLVTVPANGSTEFAVSVRVPPGASAPDTTDVQVFLGTQTSGVVRDTTTPGTVTVVPATPAVSGPLTRQRTGPTVTFNHTVTNTGDLAGTFLVSQPTLAGAPGDWMVASYSPASLDLDPQEVGNLAIVVDTPSPGSPTAPVTVTFQVSVQGSSPTRAVTQTDFITSPLVRSFSFAPRATEAITTPAGADVSFTYALTNTGNAVDSFSVTPTEPAPLTASVASTPALTNLAPGATAAVTVTYSVPTGATEGTYASTITAQATGGSSPPAAQPRAVTIRVTGGGAVQITPGAPSSDPVIPGPGGTVVTFTNTLRNTGNAAARVSLGAVTGLPSQPPGWGASLTNLDCPTGASTLGVNATCTFRVEVTVPPGAPGGPVRLGISATAFNNPPDVPDVTDSDFNVLNVQIVRGLELAPTGLSAESGPGQAIVFTHTLTNTGNAADSFDLAATQTDARWTLSVSPTVVSSLAAGVTRTIEVSAVAGPGILGGTANTITLTATGQGGGPSASVVDTVTLASVRGGDLSAGGRSNVDPGATATFTFTVVNTGTVPLSYTVALSDSLAGWSSAAEGVPTAVVAPGLTTTLTLNVTAPAEATPGVTNTTTVELLAGDGSGAPLDVATAVTGIGPRLGVLLEPESVIGEGRPNSTVELTHTLTNIGSETGTFQLSSVEILGWSVQVSPDLVTLPPGESLPVLVRVTVKPSAEAGARNFIRVRAELLSDPTVSDEAIDQVAVPLVIGLNLSSSQLRGVRPGATTSLDSLTLFNSGSAYDFYTLSISGEDANWDVILGQSIVGVNTGDPARVSVQVRVGAGVVLGTTRTLRIEARSSSDGTVRASIDLILTAIGTVDTPRVKTYLPLVQR